MNDLEGVIKKLVQFRDDREWKQFHNSKDLSIALSIEASELVELFLWKQNEEFDKERLKEELADILCYALLIANKNELDIIKIIDEKIDKNAIKYPIIKARGTSKKYNEL